MRASWILVGGALSAALACAGVQGCSSSSSGGGTGADAATDDGSTADGAGSGSSSGASSGSSGGSSSGSSSSSSSSSSGGSDSGSDAGSSSGSSSSGSSSGGATDAASDAPRDSGTDATTDAPAWDGAITCTTLNSSVLTDETVTVLGTAFPTSAATGGQIYAGTYYETHADVYADGSVPLTANDMIVIDPVQMTLSESQRAGDGGSGGTFVATYSTSGSTLTLNGVAACGSNGNKSALYKATSNTIVIYDQGSNRVSTFTLQ